MSNLLKRVADYFANVYTGDDKTAPKLDLFCVIILVHHNNQLDI